MREHVNAIVSCYVWRLLAITYVAKAMAGRKDSNDARILGYKVAERGILIAIGASSDAI